MPGTASLRWKIKQQQLRDTVDHVTGEPLQEIDEIPKRLAAIYLDRFNIMEYIVAYIVAAARPPRSKPTNK